MIPISPVSAYMRDAEFVREEWATYFAQGRANQVAEPPWRHLLYANMALIDPAASWRHFSNGSLDPTTLDSGASLTWYLTFAAALGGVE
jgi:endo-1,3(4)-beta-glucanase